LGYGNDTQKKPSQTELVAVQATAGTIAGACSSIITTPIDTIKTRLQVI
jgi:solute carrier family 25 protein 44